MDDMEVIVFEDLPSEKTPIDADNLNKMQENAKKAIKNRKPTIELLTVSSAAPTECNIGDKYYNTTTSKIYTATATNTWGTEGENPSSLYLYVDLEHKELYYFNGTTFVSYGGGSGGTGGDTLPIGAILPFSSDTIPNGWLLCDGRAVSRTEYAELFKAIGTKHGSGDGSTTFNLPNSKGRTLVGKDSTDTDFNELGKTGEGTAKDKIKVAGTYYGLVDTKIVSGTGYGGQGLVSVTKNTSESAQNLDNNGIDFMPPYLVTNFIIKAKNTVVVKGDVIQEDGTASETNVYSSVAIDNKLKTSVKVEESGDGYTKYSDGTMVCYGTASITNPTHNDWYGFCRLSNEFTFNLAKTFKDNNYSLTISSTVFGYFSTIITSKTTNSFGFRACTHNQSAYTPKNGTFDYIAIGKWK